ncbi:hypothetical protein [Actinacidiphila rubida]|uniref:Uncharacterized protein n=1 Tax=Actinacidiphila rubida TaxID=310780 RepID=A0A1H8PLK9_9ACTN|nr:hypothetical protein [Actinacidiphila rubida]SEO42617.1 hypothetical protein SAMN05216267_102627 [Actinacidiphila rubida]
MPTPLDLLKANAAQGGHTYTVPTSTRRAVEDAVTSLALTLLDDDEPDLDALNTLAELTSSLAALINARTHERNTRRLHINRGAQQ